MSGQLGRTAQKTFSTPPFNPPFPSIHTASREPKHRTISYWWLRLALDQAYYCSSFLFFLGDFGLFSRCLFDGRLKSRECKHGTSTVTEYTLKVVKCVEKTRIVTHKLHHSGLGRTHIRIIVHDVFLLWQESCNFFPSRQSLRTAVGSL